MTLSSKIITSLIEFRKALRLLGLLFLCGGAGIYLISQEILHLLQQYLGQKLAFFTVAEPFLAHVKLSFFVTLFLLMVPILFSGWRAIGTSFSLSTTSRIWFAIGTSILFYAGAGFCFFITLPFGVTFLLGFQTTQLQPLISVSKFVTFVTMFILAFGIIFELPILMVFSAKVGICARQTFTRYRRYAILVISILAALLTPTPDIMNMLLMGIPLYLLYETGILLLRILKIE